MTTSDFKKVFTQLKEKKQKLEKYKKHNSPKTRTSGKGKNKCTRCGRNGAYIQQYDLKLCRQCFRKIAKDIGFRKY